MGGKYLFLDFLSVLIIDKLILLTGFLKLANIIFNFPYFKYA